MNDGYQKTIDDLVARLSEFRKTDDARLLAIGFLMLGFDTLARLRAGNVWTSEQILEVVGGILQEFDHSLSDAEHGQLKTSITCINTDVPEGKPN